MTEAWKQTKLDKKYRFFCVFKKRLQKIIVSFMDKHELLKNILKLFFLILFSLLFCFFACRKFFNKIFWASPSFGPCIRHPYNTDSSKGCEEILLNLQFVDFLFSKIQIFNLLFLTCSERNTGSFWDTHIRNDYFFLTWIVVVSVVAVVVVVEEEGGPFYASFILWTHSLAQNVYKNQFL